jgi:serine/threonine protein kinase
MDMDKERCLLRESTAIKSVAGKQDYVPPKQFRGKPLAQSDVYALGCTLFFLLTGEDPEPISSSDPRTKRSDVNGELADIVLRATEPDCDYRLNLQDVKQLLQTLQEQTQ